jgi:acyl-CoA reductase-like NAD-dependent aldehyde dehydrogenase
MGGKNAMIVDADADLDETIMYSIYSAFGFQGQKCSGAVAFDSARGKLRSRDGTF